jgi:prepilin signal peptidase PulO-like enzyme (type II secretory pathway)
LFVTIAAFVAYPLQAILPLRNTPSMTWPIQATCWPGFVAALMGMIGVLFSVIMLKRGRLRYSFADYANYLPQSTASQAAGPSTERVSASEMALFFPALTGIIAAVLLGTWVGLAVGFASAIAVLLIGWLRGASFGQENQPTGEQVLAPDYPHARREMAVELVFLLPCIVGIVAGWRLGVYLPSSPPPVVLQALGGAFAGYLVGGGLIWGIRILGTLVFGREAMGQGDVHLLAAVGAALGWFDPILIFFLAPFSGLAWAFLSMGIASVFKRARRELPYGPHLAVATLVVMLCRPGLHRLWQNFMPKVPWPSPGLCQGPGTGPAWGTGVGPTSAPPVRTPGSSSPRSTAP